MTKGEAIELALRWLDEATVNGQEATPEQIADYRDRAAYMLDGVLKFLAGHFRIPAVHSVVQTPEKNLIGAGFGYVSVYPDAPYTVNIAGAKSYYFEARGDIFAAIGSKVITGTGDSFTAHKGNIQDAGNNTTLIITSEFPAIVRNVAMYGHAFADDALVPDYIPYVPYTLPDDFREFEGCLQTVDCHAYHQYPNVKRQGHKTFLLPYDARGQFDFHYWRNPETIPPDADDSTVLEIEERAAQLVPLKLAVDLTVGVDDTMTISYYLNDKFNSTMANILTEDRGGHASIETIYSIS